MRRRVKLLVAGLLVAVSLTFILWNTSAQSGPPALTVSDAKYQASTLGGRDVSVRGNVVEGSIQDANGSALRFTVADRLEQLPVEFHGAKPDNFGAKEVVVRGRLVETDGHWVLAASAIQVGCASKY